VALARRRFRRCAANSRWLGIDHALAARTRIALYLAAADVGEVVRALFADDRARHAYLEIRRRL
jgi:hypothetical protein